MFDLTVSEIDFKLPVPNDCSPVFSSAVCYCGPEKQQQQQKCARGGCLSSVRPPSVKDLFSLKLLNELMTNSRESYLSTSYSQASSFLCVCFCFSKVKCFHFFFFFYIFFNSHLCVVRSSSIRPSSVHKTRFLRNRLSSHACIRVRELTPDN